jgi:hypothetical protein
MMLPGTKSTTPGSRRLLMIQLQLLAGTLDDDVPTFISQTLKHRLL